MRKYLVALVIALIPGLSFAATPSQGVEHKVRRGFFTETDVGVFFTLGGQNQYSNAQTYLQLGVGYDITENIELGVHFGLGSSAQNCFAVTEGGLPCEIREGTVRTTFPDNFTLTYLNGSAAYLFRLANRFYLAPKLTAGYTLLDPAPLNDGSGNPVNAGPNFGAGIGVEYATYMDHFTIGADAMVRFVVGPNIPTVAIFPRVKYTF